MSPHHLLLLSITLLSDQNSSVLMPLCLSAGQKCHSQNMAQSLYGNAVLFIPTAAGYWFFSSAPTAELRVCHPAAWEFQAETSTVMLCRCHLRSSPFTEVPELPGPRATSKCIFQWGSSGLQIAGIAHRPSLPLWNDLGLSNITPCRDHVRGMLPGVPHISFLG